MTGVRDQGLRVARTAFAALASECQIRADSFFSSSARKPSSSTISEVLVRMKRTVDSSSSPFCRSISTRVRAGMRMES